MSDKLSALSVEERRRQYHLKPDRADVIVPAAVSTYLRSWGLKASHMMVPKVGLVDGMVLHTYEEWKAERQAATDKKAKKKKPKKNKEGQ